MAKNGKSLPYILGIDLGPASIGWAVIECDKKGEPLRVGRAGAHRFDAGVSGDIEKGKDESRATKRREARGPRRNQWRRQWRMRKVYRALMYHGLLPAEGDDSPTARHESLLVLDRELREQYLADGERADFHVLPYRLRALALEEKLPLHALGRAFYHLAQRRGYLSNRKTAASEEDRGKVRTGIAQLDDEMHAKNSRTLGQYFSQLDPEETRIRSRWTARQMYLDEFEEIWKEQQPHHTDLLTDSLKQQMFAAIFDQRPLKPQKHLIGRCTLEPTRRRAPLACMAAQRFRIWQRFNDMEVTAPDGEVRKLTDEEKNTLLEKLQTEGDVTWAAIRKILVLTKKSKEYKRGYTFNFEDGGDKKFIGNRAGGRITQFTSADGTATYGYDDTNNSPAKRMSRPEQQRGRSSSI